MRLNMAKFFILVFSLTLHFYAGAQKSIPSKDWKLAVQMWTFNKFSFLEGIDKADSCGFKYIEAFPGQKIGGHFKGEIGIGMDQTERKQLRNYQLF